MKIQLKDGEKILELNDESFDADGWLELSIGSENINLHITTLMPAIIAFDAKYSRSKEEN
jgi:hypothetical protein